MQQNIISHEENESTLHLCKSTLPNVHARVSTVRDVRSAIVQE